MKAFGPLFGRLIDRVEALLADKYRYRMTAKNTAGAIYSNFCFSDPRTGAVSPPDMTKLKVFTSFSLRLLQLPYGYLYPRGFIGVRGSTIKLWFDRQATVL